MYKPMIVGNVGNDAKILELRGGGHVCNFQVAVEVTRKSEDGEFSKHTLWFRCSLWGKQAINAGQYLVSGTEVTVIGDGDVVDYIGADGGLRVNQVIRVDSIHFTTPDRLRRKNETQPRRFRKLAPISLDDQRRPSYSHDDQDEPQIDPFEPFDAPTPPPVTPPRNGPAQGSNQRRGGGGYPTPEGTPWRRS